MSVYEGTTCPRMVASCHHSALQASHRIRCILTHSCSRLRRESRSPMRLPVFPYCVFPSDLCMDSPAHQERVIVMMACYVSTKCGQLLSSSTHVQICCARCMSSSRQPTLRSPLSAAAAFTRRRSWMVHPRLAAVFLTTAETLKRNKLFRKNLV